jgi:hypothetical protein
MKAVHNAKKGWFITSKRIKKGDQDFINGNLYQIIAVHKNGVTVLNEKREPSIIIFTLPCEHLEEGYEWDLLNNKREFRHIFPLETDNQPQIQKEKSKIDNSKEILIVSKDLKEAFDNYSEKFIEKKQKDSTVEKLYFENTFIKNEIELYQKDIESYVKKLDDSYKEQEELSDYATEAITNFSQNLQAILSNTGVLIEEDIKYMENLAKRAFKHKIEPILNPSFNDSNE